MYLNLLNYEWRLKHQGKMKPAYIVAVPDAMTSKNKTVLDATK